MDSKFAGKRVWIAGSRGMVGGALARLIPHAVPEPSRQELDLRHWDSVKNFVSENRPDVVFLAAARVGGIWDNARNPADFIADNLQIQTNVMLAAAEAGVARLVFLGSSCIYPRNAPQPMREEYLLTGPLEETNRAYAIAKLAGVELAAALRAQKECDFISVLPCNLYGPGDTYDAVRSHVIPALMLKIREALETNAPAITLWGSGAPLREFMHVDDAADALVHLAANYAGAGPVNIGTGQDISIADVAKMLCRIAGYGGDIIYDASKPDGTPRKLLDVTQLSASSWRPKIPLEQGLSQVWHQFLQAPLSQVQP